MALAWSLAHNRSGAVLWALQSVNEGESVVTSNTGVHYELSFIIALRSCQSPIRARPVTAHTGTDVVGCLSGEGALHPPEARRTACSSSSSSSSSSSGFDSLIVVISYDPEKIAARGEMMCLRGA